ncbi:hypothetical protein BROUX41_002589 [Berkeleyomyces rouxiae]
MYESCVENAGLHKSCPQYHAGISRIHYGVLWIIQVLGSRLAAGITTKSESQFLKFFETNFPFEELPVAGPLVVCFNNLCSFPHPRLVYDYVCSTLPNNSSNPSSKFVNYSSHLFLPPLTFMISLMHTFGDATVASLQIMLDNDQFGPFSYATGGNIADMSTGPAFSSFTATPSVMIAAPGVSSHWKHPVDTLLSKRVPIRRIKIPEINAGPKNTVQSYCGFETSLDWFKEVLTITSTEAKYFAGSTHLSNISTVTGQTNILDNFLAPRSIPIPPIDSWHSHSLSPSKKPSRLLKVCQLTSSTSVLSPMPLLSSLVV